MKSEARCNFAEAAWDTAHHNTQTLHTECSAPEQAGCDSGVRLGAVTNIWEFPTGLCEGGREASCIEQLAILCGQGARQQFREGRRRRGRGETRAREEV